MQNEKLHALCLISLYNSEILDSEKKIEHLFEEIGRMKFVEPSSEYVDARGYCEECDTPVEVEIDTWSLPLGVSLVDDDAVNELDDLADQLYTEALVVRMTTQNLKIDLMESIRKIEQAPEWLRRWNRMIRSIKAFFTRPLFAES